MAFEKINKIYKKVNGTYGLVRDFMTKKVFLGGTCNKSNWRDSFKEELNCLYFDPVVEDWTPADSLKEEREKLASNIHLYVLTPEGNNFYSIAEVIASATNKEKITVLVLLYDYNGMAWNADDRRSMNAVMRLAESYGAKGFTNLSTAINFINNL